MTGATAATIAPGHVRDAPQSENGLNQRGCHSLRHGEYQKLAEFETWYWWYRAERLIVEDAVRSLALPRHAALLDVGCGTGRGLAALCAAGAFRGFALDPSEYAAMWWSEPVRRCACRGDANGLPYGDGSFDAVLSVDVLQSRGVDPPEAVREMARVLRPGGHAIVLAPSHPWMLSSHDHAVHGVRRFTARQLRELAGRAGLEVVRATHQFPLWFPIIAAVRLWRKRWNRSAGGSPASDLRRIPAGINAAMFAICRIEQWAIRRMGAPFGSTLLLVAGKAR